jgi:hypothetical protein
MVGGGARCYGTPAGKVNLYAPIAPGGAPCDAEACKPGSQLLLRSYPELRPFLPRHPIVTGPTPWKVPPSQVFRFPETPRRVRGSHPSRRSAA